MEIRFSHTPITIEDMLIKIAEKNKISKFNLPIYTQENVAMDYNQMSGVRKIKRIIPSWLNKNTVQNIKRKDKEVVGVSSKVECYNGERNLIQLDIDFVYPELEDLLDNLKEVLRDFAGLFKKSEIREGFLVESSLRGFHYYGEEILDDDRWREFMNGLDKLYSPNINSNWPPLQIKRGYSILRITDSSKKSSKPKLLYKVKILKD